MSPRIVVAIGCALAGPLVFAGCGDGSTPNTQQAVPNGFLPYESDAAAAGVPDEAMEPAVTVPAPAAPSYQGSSLCRASRATCYPDDVINACDFAPDGVPADAAADAGFSFAPACHVVAGGLVPSTTCLPSTVAGMYASTCSHSTECSPGYECVDGGTCRHYCCGGNSACSDGQFCDAQPMAESPGTLVPVCLAQLPCVLLNDGSCPMTEQCSVVRDDGATSCVTVGTAQAGEPCESEHCARTLVCLGPQGSDPTTGLSLRRCQQLCLIGNPTACKSTGGTCIGTLPLFPNPFPNPAVGVCQ
jgi:hypothetical protein